MAFFPDLSPYTYSAAGQRANTVNVGWLDRHHKHVEGTAPAVFLDKLWALCSHPLLLSRGFHLCELCRLNTDLPCLARHGQETLVLGMAEIRVFGPEEQVFAAPDLLYHYVAAHNYLPPNSFIDAVLSGPAAESDEYADMIRKIGLKPVEPLRELRLWPNQPN